MDPKDPPRLGNLAVQSLLNNEPVVIRALREIPRDILVPLFNAAFKGGHKNTIVAMVKIWPFHCFHIGPLHILNQHLEILKAMIECLQILPIQNPDSWSQKLRILDLRQCAASRTICPEFYTKSLICFHSCTSAEYPAESMDVDAQCSTVDTECVVQSSRPSIQLIVKIAFDGSVKEKEFVSFLLSKVQESLGSLHLCCRDLQIVNLYKHTSTLRLLSLKCVYHLEVEQASLSDIIKILPKMGHLHRLCLSKITCRSLNGNIFKHFISILNRMNHLKALILHAFCLTDHLSILMRVLPHGMEFLGLPFCTLSHYDFRVLSQCSQTNHLKLLNISNNRIYWEDCEPFRHLLEKVSSTLMYLEVDHCMITDSTISVILPALTHCSHLNAFSFSFNPITMPMLMRILQCLTPLKELEYVIYPVPVHCYRTWHFQDSIDVQKLAAVQAKLNKMLELAQRKDMKWITHYE